MNNHSKTIKRTIWISVLAILVAGIIIFSAWASPVYAKAKKLQSLLGGVQNLDLDNIQEENITNIVHLTEQINLTVEYLRKDLEPILPLSRKLHGLPFIGKYLQLIDPGLDYAENLSEAAVILGNSGLSLLEEMDAESASNTPQILSKFFSEKQQDFRYTENLLENAVAAGKQIDPQLIPENYRGYFLTINDYLGKSPVFFDALKNTPQLFATEKAMTYLIMVQNRDELRPTGGFITAFGLLRIKEGRILALKFDDSTSYLKYNYVREIREAPYPLPKLMFAHYLVARDANWSPDFPTAAQDTQEAHLLSVSTESDAVIAFDQELIVKLLEFSGPLYIPELNSTVDADNVEEKIIEFKQTAVEADKEADRKDLLSFIAPQVMNNLLQAHDPKELIDLGKSLFELMREGHLLLYFNNPDLQSILTQLDLDGAVRTGDGDFVMVVDSNIGFSKANQYIDHSLEYSVDLTDTANPQGEILLHYEHTQPGTDGCFQGAGGEFPDYYLSRCYWNFWRVITGKGTTLKGETHTPVPQEYFKEGTQWHNEVEVGTLEEETTVFSGLTVVPQLQEENIRLETILPSSVLHQDKDGNLIYSLRIQKQPGIIILPVEIRVTAPSGFMAEDLSDGWVISLDNTEYIWQGDIYQTTDFQLTFVEL